MQNIELIICLSSFFIETPITCVKVEILSCGSIFSKGLGEESCVQDLVRSLCCVLVLLRHFILTVPLPTQEGTGELSVNPQEQQLANLWWISITLRQSSSTISCFILWNLTGISCDNLGHSACVQKFTPQLLVDYHSVNVALAPWWWQCLIKLANFSFSLLAY